MRRTCISVVAMLGCLLLASMPVATAQSVQGDGLPGSIWQQPEGDASFYIVHPDGTIVVSDLGAVGLGLWEPSGDSSLTSRVDLKRKYDGRWGTLISRADWVVDESADAATVTTTESFVGADGIPEPLGTESMTLERLHMAPMPANAHAATPADPGWQPVLGPSLYSRSEAGVYVELYSPPNYMLNHADGTGLAINPYVGDGVGLWAIVGEGWSNATMWYPTWRGSRSPLVGQSVAGETGALSTSYGTTDGFEGSAYSSPMRFKPFEGQLVAPDPSLWPTTGTVWSEDDEDQDGQVERTAYFADGTLLTVHPRYGLGVGMWQPVDEETFVSNVLYKGGLWSVVAESTYSEDRESLVTRWEADAHWTNPADDESGTSTASRMHLDP